MQKDKEEKIKEVEEPEEESLEDTIIEGDEVKLSKKPEIIDSSASEEFSDTSNFESFLQPSIETTITPPTQRRTRPQDLLEEVAETEPRQNLKDETEKQDTDYAIALNPPEYQATSEEQRATIKKPIFDTRNLSLIEQTPGKFNTRVRNQIIGDKELEALRTNPNQSGMEKNYASELKTIQSEERRLPFQRESRKYKV